MQSSAVRHKLSVTPVEVNAKGNQTGQEAFDGVAASGSALFC